MQVLSGKVNNGSFFFALAFLHILLYAETGHKIEILKLSSQIDRLLTISCKLLSDQFFVLHFSLIKISFLKIFLITGY